MVIDMVMVRESFFQQVREAIYRRDVKKLDEVYFEDGNFRKSFLYEVLDAVYYFMKKEGGSNVFVRSNMEKVFNVLNEVLSDLWFFEEGFLKGRKSERELFDFLLRNGARLIFHRMADRTGFFSILYFLVYYWERNYYRKVFPEVRLVFEFFPGSMGASFEPKENRILFYLNNLFLYANEYCPISFLLHEVSHQLFTVRESFKKSGLSEEEFTEKMKGMLEREYFPLVNIMEDIRCERRLAEINILRRYLRSGIGVLMKEVSLREAKKFLEEFFNEGGVEEKKRYFVFVCGIFMRFYLFPEIYGVKRDDFYELFTEGMWDFVKGEGKVFWSDFIELAKECSKAETVFEVEEMVRKFFERHFLMEDRQNREEREKEGNKVEQGKEQEKEQGQGEGEGERGRGGGEKEEKIKEGEREGEGQRRMERFISELSDLRELIEGLDVDDIRKGLGRGRDGDNVEDSGKGSEESFSGGIKRKFEKEFEKFVEEFAKEAREFYDKVKDERDESEEMRFSIGVKGSIVSREECVGNEKIFLKEGYSFERQEGVWSYLKDGRRFARYLVNKFRYLVEEKSDEGERVNVRSYLFKRLNLIEDGEIFLTEAGFGVGISSFSVDIVVDCSGSMHYVEDRTVKGLGFLMGVFKELEKLLLGNVKCNLFLVKGQGGTGYLIDVTDFLKREGRDNLSRYVDVISRISFDGSFEAFSMYLSRVLEGRRPDIAIVLTDAQFVDKRDWEVLKEVRGKIPLCGFYVISDEKESKEKERESMQKKESVILKNFEMAFDYWTVGSLREMKEFVEKLLRMGFEGSQEFNARKFLQECRKRKMKEERKLDFSRYVM